MSPRALCKFCGIFQATKKKKLKTLVFHSRFGAKNTDYCGSHRSHITDLRILRLQITDLRIPCGSTNHEITDLRIPCGSTNHEITDFTDSTFSTTKKKKFVVLWCHEANLGIRSFL